MNCRHFILFALAAILLPIETVAEINPTVPRDTSFTVWSTALKIRKKHPEATVLPATLPEGVSAQENVVYSHLPSTPFGPRDLHVDIYRPESSDVLPAVIMIHGGRTRRTRSRCRAHNARRAWHRRHRPHILHVQDRRRHHRQPHRLHW